MTNSTQTLIGQTHSADITDVIPALAQLLHINEIDTEFAYQRCLDMWNSANHVVDKLAIIAFFQEYNVTSIHNINIMLTEIISEILLDINHTSLDPNEIASNILNNA